ncbi:MAG: PD40 domain-containing protein [Gemmatimonadaceae bacterium]|nr:PD40 domain-containing protein [Gemmatimonadaceae bacterium]
MIITTLRRIAPVLALGFAISVSACAYDSPTEPSPHPSTETTYDLLYEQMPANSSTPKLVVRDEDSGQIRDLFDRLTPGGQPSVSADGQRVVFVAASTTPDAYDYQDIFFVTRNASPRRITLTDGPEFAPAISPNGQRIAFIRLTETGNTQLYLADIDGRNEMAVMLALAPSLTYGYNTPAWSPDGSRLLFSAGDPGRQHLHIINANGTGLRQLTDTTVSDIDGTWSPDGQTVAFVRTTSLSQSQLMIRHLTTGAERSFGFAWRNRQPAWSPDGQRIAFVSNMTDNQDLELYTVRPDGTQLTRLTDDTHRQQSPRWIAR